MKKSIKKLLNEEGILYKIILSLYFFILIVKDIFKRVLYSYFLFLKIDEKKIVISNYWGRGYGDNGKYIAEKLKDEYDVVWVLKNMNDDSIPKNIRKVKFGSAQHYKEMSTSKFWIDNVRKTVHPFKKSEQIYIQTWHGSIAFKQVEKDAEDKLNYYYKYKAKKDSRLADIFISNSKFTTEMYERAFWFDKEILEIGSPRCDIFFNEDLVKKSRVKVKSKFNIPKQKKIILYAPTFRNKVDLDVYNVDFEKILNDPLYKDFIVILRLHPNISGKASDSMFNDRILNGNNYPDMYELMAASDILITDYSSVMFEFALTNKPVFLFVKDLEEYIKERDVYFDINDLPFLWARNNQKLYNNMLKFDSKEYGRELSNFYKDIELCESGNSSEQLYKYIKSHTR